MTVPGRYFRAGAGAVIANSDGLVLVCERADVPGAWQLPQGGLERDEEPLEGVLREIEEETGITRDGLELIGHYPEPLVYELPVEARSEKTGMGQVQYWFLFRYRGSDPDLRRSSAGEFRRSAWQSFEQVLARVVDFRRPVYRQLYEAFGAHLRRA